MIISLKEKYQKNRKKYEHNCYIPVCSLWFYIGRKIHTFYWLKNVYHSDNLNQPESTSFYRHRLARMKNSEIKLFFSKNSTKNSEKFSGR